MGKHESQARKNHPNLSVLNWAADRQEWRAIENQTAHSDVSTRTDPSDSKQQPESVCLFATNLEGIKE